MMLAGMLIQDHEARDQQAFAAPGDQLDVVGELDAFTVPAHWDEVHAVLSGSTYRLEQDDSSDLFLVTGMDAGWDGTTVVAHVVVVLETGHPDRDARIVVLSLADQPAVPR